ncbi:hypothetical protein NDU88_008896 [Pleurodeles waltl]|uniref:Uncharacterized protein n=1 Tax=Pleurodeles waltl TaxID=8319 RepID=A0AAV7NA64_PLEWA|nr:hypothetical protein NDU88_008896 [Pleurodeles waltl]
MLPCVVCKEELGRCLVGRGLIHCVGGGLSAHEVYTKCLEPCSGPCMVCKGWSLVPSMVHSVVKPLHGAQGVTHDANHGAQGMVHKGVVEPMHGAQGVRGAQECCERVGAWCQAWYTGVVKPMHGAQGVTHDDNHGAQGMVHKGVVEPMHGAQGVTPDAIHGAQALWSPCIVQKGVVEPMHGVQGLVPGAKHGTQGS